MDSFIDRLVEAAAEPVAEGRSLADRIRDSYDAEVGTYDGYVVDDLIAMINRLVDKTPEEEVRHAFNDVARQEGLAPLEEGEILAGPYADMFIDVVLAEIDPRNHGRRVG